MRRRATRLPRSTGAVACRLACPGAIVVEAAAAILHEAAGAVEAAGPASLATLAELLGLRAGLQRLVPLVVLGNAIVLLRSTHDIRSTLNTLHTRLKEFARTLILASSMSLAISSSCTLSLPSKAELPLAIAIRTAKSAVKARAANATDGTYPPVLPRDEEACTPLFRWRRHSSRALLIITSCNRQRVSR
jgi:hypothetical protein